MEERRGRSLLKRHVFARRPSTKRDISPPLHYEKTAQKTEMAKTPVRDKNEPYRVSVPKELWFVPDEMYLVDSKFSRSQNITTLETKLDVMTDLEKSDENHLVWPNYHSLTRARIQSFLELKSSGLYLLIDSLKWNTPTKPNEYKFLNKHFNKLANDHTDKIAQLIMDYPEHFGKTNQELKSIQFSMEIFYSDANQKLVAKRFKDRLQKYYELYSEQKNLNWEFNIVEPKDARTEEKFQIDIHLNTSSYFMGIKIFDWEDSFPQFHTTTRFGAPIIDLLKLADIEQGMVVMDLDTGFAENILEMFNITKCHTIGIVQNKKQANAVLESVNCAKVDRKFENAYNDFIMVPSINDLPELFNTKILDRVLYRTSKYMEDYDEVDENFKKILKIMNSCSSGCIFLFVLPIEECVRNWFEQWFGYGVKYEIFINTVYTEIRKQRRVIKIIKN